jgi:hypothetical protein
MLMHTKGILVMTPDSAMVLTGKQSLDFSGGVSAEDNFGIGGYDRVMGPNGQAQYWAPNLGAAMGILLGHYDHTYIASGEDRARAGPSASTRSTVTCRTTRTPPKGRSSPPWARSSPTRRTPTGRSRSTSAPSSRLSATPTTPASSAGRAWRTPRRPSSWTPASAATPVCVLGIESKPVPRQGFPPTDGPDTYTGGTLFPRSSKKAARAINAASGNRPLVVLANLSGFDGSPESMRNLQLEYGAEIGRAIVNFDGPIVFVVISRYHGGAFVVFSKRLNENMTVLAIEGSFASVLGGAPAAAVVFAGDVAKRTASDPRVASAGGAAAGGARRDARGRCSWSWPTSRGGGARGEDLRGGRRVRRRPQHPPGRRGGLGGPRDHARAVASGDRRGDRGARVPLSTTSRPRPRVLGALTLSPRRSDPQSSTG